MTPQEIEEMIRLKNEAYLAKEKDARLRVCERAVAEAAEWHYDYAHDERIVFPCECRVCKAVAAYREAKRGA